MFTYLRAIADEVSREAILTLVLAIDIYYRIEWFELHTPAAAFLHPFFGGE